MNSMCKGHLLSNIPDIHSGSVWHSHHLGRWLYIYIYIYIYIYMCVYMCCVGNVSDNFIAAVVKISFEDEDSKKLRKVDSTASK
jgi:hypothetical protein